MLFYLTFVDLRSQDFVVRGRRSHLFLEQNKVVYKLLELIHPQSADFYTQRIYEMQCGDEMKMFDIYVRRVS